VRTPEERARYREYQRARYRTDPEYREQNIQRGYANIMRKYGVDLDVAREILSAQRGAYRLDAGLLGRLYQCAVAEEGSEFADMVFGPAIEAARRRGLIVHTGSGDTAQTA